MTQINMQEINKTKKLTKNSTSIFSTKLQHHIVLYFFVFVSDKIIILYKFTFLQIFSTLDFAN